MINHVRTLLLNKEGSKRPGADFFYEEYVPPAYHEVALGQLLPIRSAVFGSKSDNAFLNFRLHQVMKAIHSTEYVSYVTALDPRITYDTSNHTILEPEPSYIIHALTGTVAATDLTFLGSAGTEGETTLQHSWLINIPYGNTVNIVNQVNGKTIEEGFTFADGLSSIIELPGTDDLSFRFTVNPPVNGRWLVSIRKRPVADIYSSIAALESLGEEMNSVLFSSAEPYQTFKQVWLFHPWWTYRLTGVMLALAYKTEAIRND